MIIPPCYFEHVRFLGGAFGWRFWVALLGGAFGWRFWVALLGGAFGWRFWVAQRFQRCDLGSRTERL
jgi:hypothetical protein